MDTQSTAACYVAGLVENVTSRMDSFVRRGDHVLFSS